MKKIFLTLFFLLTFLPLGAQQYKISNVTYNITGCGHWIFGCTQEYALATQVPIDKKTTFENEEAFNAYLADLEKRLANLRTFETIEVTSEIESLISPYQQEEINLVRLIITVKDSFHLFAIPGPKYDSNTGLTFKLKIKDSNFLGGLNTLNSDLFILMPTSESDGTSTEFGLNCSADYPFQAGIFDAVWLNSLSFSYTLGNKMPEWNVRTGLSFTLPFEKTALKFETNQRFVNNFEYEEFEDSLYFQNDFTFSLPLKITEFAYFGKLSWTPYTSATINWDFNGISKENSSLSSPIVTFGHSLGFGRIDWAENLRTGLSLYLSNYYTYNFQRNRFYPEVELESKMFKKISLLDNSYFLNNLGLALYTKTFTYLFNPNKDEFIDNDGSSIGQYLRGIRDSQEYLSKPISALCPTSAFILNIDIPIHIFTTNFTKSFLRYMNFDFQLSPFFDMALCYNKITQTFFNFKDGFYAAGLEVIVYPLKWSGITLRASVGLDIGRQFFADSINMDWRQDVSKKEFSVGFGLHY